MAYEHLKNAALPRTLSDVIADVADLIQKEIRLARAEISDKLTTKVHGGVWMGVAGFLGLIGGIMLAQAAVYAIAVTGLALYWCYLIIGGALAIIAAVALLKGRSDMAADMTPDRTMRNVRQDIATAKEQLT